MSTAWLVVMDRGGIFGCWADEDRARADEAARNIGGLLIELPVTADYRTDPAEETPQP